MTLLKKLLSAAICLSFAVTGVNAATEFSDVDNNKWYADEISTAYNHGLLAGTADGKFSPEDNITISQAVTLASRANALYYNKSINEAEGSNWYTPYFDYATSNGIVKSGEFSSPDAIATRQEVAVLFSRCLPTENYEAINDVYNIPDVDRKSDDYKALLSMYKAGILTGSDEYGHFRPRDNITRAEVTAILNRTLFPERRVKFDIEKYSYDEAYVLCYQERGMIGQKDGISSGWIYYNGAGNPQTSYDIDYNSLIDTKDDDHVAMIREFNNTDTGTLNLETQVFLTENAFDGFVLEYQNKNDETVYRLYTDNGCFYIDTPTGNVNLTGNVRSTSSFVLNIDVDLDNGKSTTAINKTSYGQYPICTAKEETDIQRLVLRTTDEDKTVVSLTNVYITVNYGFYDLFETGKDGKIPYGWKGQGAVNSDGTLDISRNGYASRTFKPISGVVAANAEFNLTQNQSIQILLLSDGKTVAKFSTNSRNFLFGTTSVYQNYYKNLWYRLRIEADTYNDTAKIWVNGRVVATLPLLEKVSYINEIKISNTSRTAVSFDVINVFERVEHDDYVPEPVSLPGEEEYLIGMNICSLWKNGEHYGWACIAAFEDREPVLGFYDEGVPETADWEIKFMVEHGIDFQAFCWYADQNNAPMKKMHLSPHLYDGYMYAKYSDRMKYCLIWEAANAQAPKDLNAWNSYYVPYFIENFFKDDRYLVIDNKPVLSVFGQAKLLEKIGGDPATLRAMFDSLEEAVVELGFDGMIYLCCGSSSSANAEMGFDGTHAYGWGNNGYKFSVNKSSVLKSAAFEGMHTVPTISVGFNSVPWHNIRYPIMTSEDYKISHEWVRDEYLPKYAEKGTWEENFVWLSTWNEYGEGTYMMPCDGTEGFGYLDALVEVYTGKKSDEATNVVPTEAQKRRITRLYPQHHRILRKQGYYKNEISYDTLQKLSEFNYNTANISNIRYYNLKDVSITKDDFYAVLNGDGIIQALNLNVSAEQAQFVAVTVDGVPGTKVEVFFITDTDPNWTQDKSGSFYIEEKGMRTGLVDLSKNEKWKGTITAIRVDVGNCEPGMGTVEEHAFTIKKSEFMHTEEEGTKFISINGMRFEMQLPYVIKNGDYYVAFDPKIGFDYRLGMFMEWDYLTKTLRLDNGTHKAEFVIGKSTFILDGKQKTLPYTLTDFDGLPLFEISHFCDVFDYDVSLNKDGEIEIFTHEYEYYKNFQENGGSAWEFNNLGDNEGWVSSNMALFTYDGYVRLETTSASTDPSMSLKRDIALDASKYTTVTVRCRYKYNATYNQSIALYFLTSTDSTWNEAKDIRISLPSTDSNGEWIEVSYSLPKISTWNGTITSLRFDPFSTTGYMEIDYIRFS